MRRSSRIKQKGKIRYTESEEVSGYDQEWYIGESDGNGPRIRPGDWLKFQHPMFPNLGYIETRIEVVRSKEEWVDDEIVPFTHSSIYPIDNWDSIAVELGSGVRTLIENCVFVPGK